MNVLFYMQPWIEKNKPTYRSQSFLKDQQTVIDCLLKHAPDVKIHCIIGDALSLMNSDEIAQLPSDIILHVLTQSELKEIFHDYRAEVAAFYRKSAENSSEENQKFRELLSRKMAEFVPDVVFTFENYDSHLRAAFPEAVVINQYFSPFSREPFPRLTCFDCNGIFKNALTTSCQEELRGVETTPSAIAFMDQIRASFFDDMLLSYDYTSQALAQYRKAFEFLVSLPMQGSNYFAFEGNSRFTNLFDYICHVLDRIDPRVGVVVTEHSAHEPVLTENLCRYLRLKYPNFIYIEAFKDYAFHSQQVLCHIDAVLTVSSSLSFMAAMQKKLAFCIGDFESFVSQGNEIERIYEELKSVPDVDYDGAFHYLFQHFYVPVNQMAATEGLYDFVKMIIENVQGGKKHLAVYSNASTGLKTASDVVALARKEKFISKLPASIQQTLAHDVKASSQGQEIPAGKLLKNIRSEKYQVISFDMFDTLVVRPFIRPRHLFLTVEKEARKLLRMDKLQFAKAREKTEKRLRKQKKAISGYWQEVPLSEIYEALQEELSFSPAEVDAIMEFERQTELQLCSPMRFNQDFFKAALAVNARVIVTTDIYLDEKLIRQILSKCGYDGFDDLFVSSSYGCRKQDGRLYEHVINELSVRPEQILHIGDNAESDGLLARSTGIDSCIIPKPVDRVIREFSRLERLSTMYKDHDGHSRIFGTLSNMLAETLGTKKMGKDSHGNFSPYCLGAVIFGPLLYGFSTWLHTSVTHSEIARLHFLAREGALLKSAYDAVSEARGGGAHSTYLLASRRSALAATMNTRSDINALIYKKQSACSLHHILGYKLGLSRELYDDAVVQLHGFTQIHDMVDLQRDRLKLQQLIDALEKPILENAAEEREAYKTYLREQNVAAGRQAEAIVDIGYAGTIQTCLQKLMDFEFSGFYLGVKRDGTDSLNARMTGYLFDEPKAINLHLASAFERNTLLFEACLCAPTQSFFRMQLERGQAISRFNIGSISTEHKCLIEQLHNGALDYLRYVLAHIPEDEHLDREMLIGMGQDFFREPSAKEAALFADVSFDNRMGAAVDKYLVPSTPEIMADEKLFLWPEGTRAVLSASEKTSHPVRVKDLISYA